MKIAFLFVIAAALAAAVSAQSAEQKIYETERAFEKMVAEKGIKAGFLEFMAPTGIVFAPDAVNARERWLSRPASPAALTWDPIRIEVSSNGALGYSIGASMFRPKGMDDTNIAYGHYLSIWTRQPGGDYRAALDTGISHEKPMDPTAQWKPSAGARRGPASGESAGDHSTGFFSAVPRLGAASAYKDYLADDAIVLRDGGQPFFGKKAALGFLKKSEAKVVFARRKSFIEAGDLAYVNSTYVLTDKAGRETEKGNFVQVWKLIGGKWKIAADIFVPLPK